MEKTHNPISPQSTRKKFSKMESHRKTMAADGDRLSDLPDSLLIHILSRLYDREEVVRSSVLSTRWRFLWKSVPVSASFSFSADESLFVANTHRDLHYLRSFSKIHYFHVDFPYDKLYTKDIDLWVYFATRAAHVEYFILQLSYRGYELPQFAYNNSSLNRLLLSDCKLNPCGSVSWSSLSSLSLHTVGLTDKVMKEVLSGCPNLECLKIQSCCDLDCLEISSVKLRKLIISSCFNLSEIVAPYVHILRISGHWHLQLSNVASLVTVFLKFDDDDDDKFPDDDDGDGVLEKHLRYFKELLGSLVHVKNLELNFLRTELLSLMEWKGWQLPASRQKLLTVITTLSQHDFAAICGLLQSSPELETLVIHWSWSWKTRRDFYSRFINKDEKGSRFESYFNYSLLHLKTIKIICDYQQPRKIESIMPFVKHLLKHAEVLEKLVVCCNFKGSCVKMKQEILTFPRSSEHAVVVFTNT